MRFLQEKDVRFVIQTAWSPGSYGGLLSDDGEHFSEVFRNRDFKVYRELFTFLRSQTQPSDLLLFSKPVRP